MIFLEKISSLSHPTSGVSVKEESYAVLIGSCDLRPDHAKHIIFNPMSDGLIAHLLQSYKGNIPDELLRIYQKMNGADLFWTTRYVQKAKLHIPFCMFSIYGIPCSDSRKNVEPFNISIEDLHRPQNTPTTWLKFGAYNEPQMYSQKYDLYIDTEEICVYSVEHDNSECQVVRSWATIDSCLCDIFDLLAKAYG